MFKTASSQAVISVLVVLMFGGVLLAIIFHPMAIDATMKDMLLIMLGALGSNFTSVVGYYMGSSQGSKHANETLSNIATTSTAGTGNGTAPPAL